MTPVEFEVLVREAESGDSDAMYRLGMMYRAGKNFHTLAVPKDGEKSHQYFEKAAESGHALAAWRIGSREGFPFLQTVVQTSVFCVKCIVKFATHAVASGALALIVVFKLLFKFAGWSIVTAIVLGLVWLTISSIAALPVSLAVIIGAVIIASSTRR